MRDEQAERLIDMLNGIKEELQKMNFREEMREIDRRNNEMSRN